MYKVSTNFLVLMSFQFMPGKGIGWHSKEALQYLGIPCRPSASRNDPIPSHLNHTTAREISDLIDAIGQEKNVDHARGLVEGSSAPFHAARVAYIEWYRFYLSKNVNKRMNMAMAAANATIPYVLSQQEDDSFPHTNAFSCSDIGTELLGEVICNGMVLSNKAMPLVKGLITGALGRVRKNYNKGQGIILGKRAGKSREMETSLWLKTELVMKELMREDSPSVEGKAVMQAIEYIKVISKHICWVPTKMAELEEWRSFLKGLADGEGLEVDFEPEVAVTDAQVDKVERARKQGSRKKISTVTMSDLDLKILFDSLVDHFASTQTSVALNPLDEEEDDTLDLYDIFDKDGADIGVTKFKHVDDESLMKLLDFPEGRPVLFAKYRHKDTMTTSWDTPEASLWTVGGDEVQPLRLLWHQLCGVACLVDGVFQQPGTGVRHRLLADDVGIGKSAQVMGVIAFLILVWFVETKGKPRPPIIANSERKFMGHGPVPNHPHLIVVPNSLVPQWTRELKIFFKYKQIEIHILPTSEAGVEAYLQSDEWVQSETPMILRILLVSHSALATLTGQYFATKKLGPQPVDTERKLRSSRKSTLFGILFCLIAIDEIHEFRGPTTRNFIGAVALARATSLMIGCTATPIVSQPRDLINLGRILRIPECSGDQGRRMELDFNRRLRTAQKAITEDDKQESTLALASALRANTSVDQTGLSPRHTTVKAVRYEMVKNLQRILGPIMIRRTIQSKRWDGDKINPNLPDKSVSNFCVLLTDNEHALLNAELGIVGGSLEGQVFDFERFWVHYRQYLCVPLPELSTTLSKDILWPIYETQEDFKAAGSKLKKLVQLVQYHSKYPAAAQIQEWSEPSKDMVWPEVPSNEASRDPPKILVFFHFAAMARTIISALVLHDIKVECLTGSMSVKKRSEATDNWVTSKDITVLLFSTVGATGMNLSQARIVIHLDVSWSGVFQQQIDGRAWRYGQTEEVFVYRMVALGTTDVTMSAMAGDKMTFLGALTKQAKDHVLEKVLQNIDEDQGSYSDLADEDEGVDDEDDKPRGGSTSKKGKARSKTKGNGKAKEQRQADIRRDIEDEMATTLNDDDGRPPAKNSTKKNKVKAKKAKAKSGLGNQGSVSVDVKGKGRAVDSDEAENHTISPEKDNDLVASVLPQPLSKQVLPIHNIQAVDNTHQTALLEPRIIEVHEAATSPEKDNDVPEASVVPQPLSQQVHRIHIQADSEDNTALHEPRDHNDLPMALVVQQVSRVHDNQTVLHEPNNVVESMQATDVYGWPSIDLVYREPDIDLTSDGDDSGTHHTNLSTTDQPDIELTDTDIDNSTRDAITIAPPRQTKRQAEKRKAGSPAKIIDPKRTRLRSPIQAVASPDTRIISSPTPTMKFTGQKSMIQPSAQAGPSRSTLYQPAIGKYHASQESINSFSVDTPLEIPSSSEDEYKPIHRVRGQRAAPLLMQREPQALTQEQAAYRPQSFVLPNAGTRRGSGSVVRDRGSGSRRGMNRRF